MKTIEKSKGDQIIFEICKEFSDTITVTTDKSYLSLDVWSYNEDGNPNSTITLSKDESINLAKSILKYYTEE